jgi:hypothetical protein
MNKEFYRDLSELVKKHSLTLVAGKDLRHLNDKFDGMSFFITNGKNELLIS